MNDELTPKQRLFVAEYLKDLNATQAALRAGYSPRTAFRIGAENLQKPATRLAIDSAIALRVERVEVTTDDVLRELWRIAKADPGEIIEHRRVCCRFCWGLGFKYQRTANERQRDHREHERRELAKLVGENSEAVEEFDEQGGVGFDARKEPNLDCPECFGEGISEVFVKDTRLLSPAARALYAGVKTTKDGIEIKLHPKDKALELVGRHIGMFPSKVELTGKDGGPVEVNDSDRVAKLHALFTQAKENAVADNSDLV